VSNGVDLYVAYQQVTSWAAVRNSGRTFAYLKGTDGMTTRDTANWPAAAHAAGVAVGLYGYAQPGSARDQYDLLYRTARDRNAADLSPALDQESPFVPGNSAVQFAVAWLLRAVEVGEIPVYYANDSFMTYCLPAIRAAVPTVWPWIARYGSPPRNPYRTWQHSSTGNVPGITASGVDLNVGDAPVRSAAGPIPTPAPTPGNRPAVALLEDTVMDPVIYQATPVTKDANGKDIQVEHGQQVVPPCGGQLIVTPLDDQMCFFGNPEPGAPVYCYGLGGGKGGGHSVVPPAQWQDDTERRATRLNTQAYEVPKGTTRVAYALSSNGRTAVQFVPSYLLG
jgi:GH25 family lysozyme M1 (1,4-beta-N-acetylmuramidase)